MGRKNKSKDMEDAESAGENRNTYLIPAVDRAARVLSLLKNERRGMTIAEISDAMDCNKVSIYRLLHTMDYHGLLARDPITKKYSLGAALMEYGRAILNGFDIQHAARPSLKALVAFSGETAALLMLHGTKLMILEVEESTTELHVSLAVGMTNPATATSGGKAILAYLPEKHRNEIIQAEGLCNFAKRSITNSTQFRKDLEATRKRGYAIDHEEFKEGITGVSAPVFSSQGAVGAIGIVLPSFKMTNEIIRTYGRKCAEEAARLSGLLL